MGGAHATAEGASDAAKNAKRTMEDAKDSAARMANDGADSIRSGIDRARDSVPSGWELARRASQRRHHAQPPRLATVSGVQHVMQPSLPHARHQTLLNLPSAPQRTPRTQLAVPCPSCEQTAAIHDAILVHECTNTPK